MPFASYTSLGGAANAFGITLEFDEFLRPMPFAVSDHLKEELHFAHDHVAFESSEFAPCENFIYPILKEVWKHYTDALTVWSHMPLHYDANLSGTPDYFVARKSPLGHYVMEKPRLMVVEAKKDDFSRGWGQCLPAMLAAQKINAPPELPIQGITTNGRVWEFGRLEHSTLTRDPRPFTLGHLEEVCAAVSFLFEQCRLQIVGPSRAA